MLVGRFIGAPELFYLLKYGRVTAQPIKKQDGGLFGSSPHERIQGLYVLLPESEKTLELYDNLFQYFFYLVIEVEDKEVREVKSYYVDPSQGDPMWDPVWESAREGVIQSYTLRQVRKIVIAPHIFKFFSEIIGGDFEDVGGFNAFFDAIENPDYFDSIANDAYNYAEWFLDDYKTLKKLMDFLDNPIVRGFAQRINDLVSNFDVQLNYANFTMPNDPINDSVLDFWVQDKADVVTGVRFIRALVVLLALVNKDFQDFIQYRLDNTNFIIPSTPIQLIFATTDVWDGIDTWNSTRRWFLDLLKG